MSPAPKTSANAALLVVAAYGAFLLATNPWVTVFDDEEEAIADREVTIMGDREIPYSLLKKVMATCTAADYGRLSLAVLQKAENTAGVQVAAGG